MTFYAGEEFRITTTVDDFDGVALTDADVTDVVITIFDSEQTEIASSSMTWETDEWVYLWNTNGLDAGSYRYRIAVEGVNGNLSWEWRRARLARNPIEVA